MFWGIKVKPYFDFSSVFSPKSKMKALGAIVLLIVLQLWICSAEDISVGDLNCLFVDYGETHGYTAIFLQHLKTGQHLPEKNDSSVIQWNLAMAMNITKKIPNGLFDKFENLHRLDVLASNMEILDRNSLNGASNLVELDFSGNLISRLEADKFVDSVKQNNITLHDN